MRKLVLVSAAVAALSITASAEAAIVTTNYSVSGLLTGTFSLDFDSATSAYTVGALDVHLGPTFYPSNAGVIPFASNLILGGNLSGGVGGVASGNNDFFFQFDPTAASQTVGLTYAFAGLGSIGSSSATTTQVGSAGTVTDYSVIGSLVSGTFSVDLSTNTLTALVLLLGPTFDPSNAGVTPFASNLILGGNLSGGVGGVASGNNDFFFQFDPTAASQTVGLTYAIAGLGSIGSSSVSVSQIAAPPGVPEPGAWAMMLLGFTGIGIALRTKRLARVGVSQPAGRR